MKNIEEFSGKSSEEWTIRQKKKEDKTERITGLGRRTREEMVKWNQMTALRFQTGGRHQTSLASLWGYILALVQAPVQDVILEQPIRDHILAKLQHALTAGQLLYTGTAQYKITRTVLLWMAFEYTTKQNPSYKTTNNHVRKHTIMLKLVLVTQCLGILIRMCVDLCVYCM